MTRQETLEYYRFLALKFENDPCLTDAIRLCQMGNMLTQAGVVISDAIWFKDVSIIEEHIANHIDFDAMIRFEV